MKGLAAVFTGGSRPVDLINLEVPKLQPGGILVRNTGAAVCGSDLHGWRGDGDGPPSSRKMVGGHECSGVIEALGPGISTDSKGRKIQVGDRVVYPFFFPCLRCYQCVHGELHACPNRYHPRFKADTFNDYPYCDGGFAQYWSLPPGHFVFKAPEAIPDKVLATVNCSLTQVTWAIHQGNMRFGDTVVVQGAGGLGIYATAIAADAGASKVIVIDGQTGRLELAKKCGATDTIDMREFATPAERIARVQELTAGVGADIVVEVVGVASATLEVSHCPATASFEAKSTGSGSATTIHGLWKTQFRGLLRLAKNTRCSTSFLTLSHLNKSKQHLIRLNGRGKKKVRRQQES